MALPARLLQTLREEAERRGTAPEALLVDLLLDVASEEEKPLILLDAARSLARRAREWEARGNHGEAYRRLWAAALLALEAYAAARRLPRPRSLADYWSVAGRAAGELGEAALDALYAGLAAFVAYREGLGDGSHVEGIAGRVEALASAVEEAARR